MASSRFGGTPIEESQPLTVMQPETPLQKASRFGGEPISTIQGAAFEPKSGPGTFGPTKEEFLEEVVDPILDYPGAIAEKPGETISGTLGGLVQSIPGVTYATRKGREKQIQEAGELPLEEIRRRTLLKERPYAGTPGAPSSMDLMEELAGLSERDLRRRYAQHGMPSVEEQTGEQVGRFGGRLAQSLALTKLLAGAGPGKPAMKLPNKEARFFMAGADDFAAPSWTVPTSGPMRRLASDFGKAAIADIPFVTGAMEEGGTPAALEELVIGTVLNMGLAGLKQIAGPNTAKHLTQLSDQVNQISEARVGRTAMMFPRDITIPVDDIFKRAQENIAERTVRKKGMSAANYARYKQARSTIEGQLKDLVARTPDAGVRNLLEMRGHALMAAELAENKIEREVYKAYADVLARREVEMAKELAEQMSRGSGVIPTTKLGLGGEVSGGAVVTSVGESIEGVRKAQKIIEEMADADMALKAKALMAKATRPLWQTEAAKTTFKAVAPRVAGYGGAGGGLWLLGKLLGVGGGGGGGYSGGYEP